MKNNRDLQLLDKVDESHKNSEEQTDWSRAGEENLRRAMDFVSSFANQVPSGASAVQNGPVQSAPSIYGIANYLDNPFNSSYFSVDPDTGEKVEIGKLDFRVDSSFDPIQMTNGSTSHETAGFVPGGFQWSNHSSTSAVFLEVVVAVH